MVPSEFLYFHACVSSNTGKVFFEWCKEVTDNRDAPRPAQEPLSRQPAHVGHVRIVDRKTEDPGDSDQEWGAEQEEIRKFNTEVLPLEQHKELFMVRSHSPGLDGFKRTLSGFCMGFQKPRCIFGGSSR